MTRPCTHKSRLVSSGWSMSLYPLKRTYSSSASMSAMCQKRPFLSRRPKLVNLRGPGPYRLFCSQDDRARCHAACASDVCVCLTVP